MYPTKKQYSFINSMQKKNPSMLPIQIAHMSNKCLSLTISWVFEPNEFYKSTIDENGCFVGPGMGPFYHKKP